MSQTEGQLAVHDVVEVQEFESYQAGRDVPDEVNEHLERGWILLAVATYPLGEDVKGTVPVYVLGRPRALKTGA